MSRTFPSGSGCGRSAVSAHLARQLWAHVMGRFGAENVRGVAHECQRVGNKRSRVRRLDFSLAFVDADPSCADGVARS
jgi:lysophospholipid acyltransferase (LPLAT)-like uncharacterized protein